MEVLGAGQAEPFDCEFFSDPSEGVMTLNGSNSEYSVRFITKDDLGEMVRLRAKPENVKNFAGGKPLTPLQTLNRVNTWVQRIKDGNPFSALVVHHLTTSNLAAYCVAGGADFPKGIATTKAITTEDGETIPAGTVLQDAIVRPGWSEIAIVVDAEHRGGVLAGPIARLFIEHLVPILSNHEIGGAQLRGFEATALKGSTSADHLERMGFVKRREFQKFEDPRVRNFYELKVTREEAPAAEGGGKADSEESQTEKDAK